MIRYVCPNCRAELENPSEMAGRPDACPACGQQHSVPTPKARPLAVILVFGVAVALVIVGVVLTVMGPGAKTRHGPQPADEAAAIERRQDGDLGKPLAQQQPARPAEASEPGPATPRKVSIGGGEATESLPHATGEQTRLTSAQLDDLLTKAAVSILKDPDAFGAPILCATMTGSDYAYAADGTQTTTTTVTRNYGPDKDKLPGRLTLAAPASAVPIDCWWEWNVHEVGGKKNCDLPKDKARIRVKKALILDGRTIKAESILVRTGGKWVEGR